MSTLNEWKAIAEYHAKQLAYAEKKVKEISVDPTLITEEEFTKRVSAMMTGDRRRMWSWNRAIEDGLIRNVRNILNECYEHYIHSVDKDEEFELKAKELLGPFGGLKWQLFMLSVIEHLVQKGSFINENGSIDTFEDTAGGCDEIVWDVGFKIIDETIL